MATPLDTLAIAEPCPASWDRMRGGDRSRVCGLCRKPVFDLAAMTTAEAGRLLGDADHPPCVRLHRGPDGRAMTADGPTGVRGAIWRRLRRRAAWAASAFALLFLPACRASYGMPARSVRSISPTSGHAPTPDENGHAVQPRAADGGSTSQSASADPLRDR